MLKAKPAKEIAVRVRNQVGVLAQISKLVADKGINILAASAWVEGDDGVVHLVTDDNLRTADMLRAQKFSPTELDVVLVETPHKPGMLRRVTEKLAQNQIDIHYLYASATADQDKCLIVFASANNDRALVLLNEK
jgi:hypothetical protein